MLGLAPAPRPRRAGPGSARNALRHGLSFRVYSEPILSEQVEALAREIAGTDANAEIHQFARRIAEAQIDLRRVRRTRHQFLSNQLNDPYYDSRANMRTKVAVICKLLRPNAPDAYSSRVCGGNKATNCTANYRYSVR